MEAQESVTETLEAARYSTHPLDLELLRLFETITGRTWDDVINQWTVQILDWSARPTEAEGDQDEQSSQG
jgi:hypothetical protein